MAHIWNPERETMPRDELEEFQGEKLREQVTHVYNNAAFFRELYDEHGIHPNDINDRSDLTKLPTCDKDDLRAYRDRTGDFWCGCLCVPESELTVATRSTGTSGDPNYFGLTAADEEAVAEHFARMWYAWGLHKGDKLNLPEHFWHGYLIGQDLGAREIGAVPIRCIGGTQDFASMAFEQLPQADLDAIHVYEPETELKYINENDIDPRDVFPNVRFVYSAVDATKPRRDLWEEMWDVPFFNGYGSGDQFFTAFNCPHDLERFHLSEDHFIYEVLDSDTGEPVAPGEYGELHVTNLRDEANPYLRYNMEDYVTYELGECECGRTTMRLRPLGRESWSVEVEGRNQPITSMEVEDVVWRFDEVFGDPYQLVEEQPGTQSRLYVRIASEGDVDDATIADITGALESAFGVDAYCEVVEPGAIGLESSIKLERVVEEY